MAAFPTRTRRTSSLHRRHGFGDSRFASSRPPLGFLSPVKVCSLFSIWEGHETHQVCSTMKTRRLTKRMHLTHLLWRVSDCVRTFAKPSDSLAWIGSCGCDSFRGSGLGQLLPLGPGVVVPRHRRADQRPDGGDQRASGAHDPVRRRKPLGRSPLQTQKSENFPTSRDPSFPTPRDRWLKTMGNPLE